MIWPTHLINPHRWAVSLRDTAFFGYLPGEATAASRLFPFGWGSSPGKPLSARGGWLKIQILVKNLFNCQATGDAVRSSFLSKRYQTSGSGKLCILYCCCCWEAKMRVSKTVWMALWPKLRMNHFTVVIPTSATGFDPTEPRSRTWSWSLR